MIPIQRIPAAALSLSMCVVAFSTGLSAQEARTPRPSSQPAPRETPLATTQGRSATPQGFSVVLVLGDIQSTTPSDDVPPAARKALTDMRDFLPYKSYRLLDAAWLLCCGQESRRSNRSAVPMPSETISQMLRGPDGQEYELRLATSHAEGARVFVRFSLEGAGESEKTAIADGEAAAARRLAEAQDRKKLLEVQLQEARKKFDVGVIPKTEVTRLELELRSEQRRIEDLTARSARGSRGTSRAAAFRPRQRVLDTSFTMDIGETVVVGTSRLKGGSKALIALLTAVPARGARD